MRWPKRQFNASPRIREGGNIGWIGREWVSRSADRFELLVEPASKSSPNVKRTVAIPIRLHTTTGI
jgi:hypothetical protein